MTSWREDPDAVGIAITPEGLTLTPAEVASLRDVLRYCGRVVAGTAELSDLELSELALRTAVLAKALERAGEGTNGHCQH